MFSTTLVSPRRERWLTAVFFLLSGLVSATWASRIPDVQQQFRLNDAQWGQVLFALPAGLITGLPVSSWLVARFGSRNMRITGGILFSLMLCMLGVASQVWQLSVALFFFGFLRNLFNISVNTSAIEVQQQYDRPIVSSFHGLWSLSCFAAAGIGAWMIAQQISTDTHFLLIALACSFLCILFRGDRKKNATAATEKRPLFVKPDKYLFLLGVITFCGMLCEGTMFDWSVNYFDKVVGAPKSVVTTGYTCFIVAMAAGRLLGDKVVARFGPTKVLVANGLLIAAGLTMAVVFPYFIGASLGFLLAGLGISIVVPQVYSLCSQTKIMKPSYAIASVTFIGYMGFLSGPILIGFISEWAGMQWAFALVALLSLGICGLTMKIRNL